MLLFISFPVFQRFPFELDSSIIKVIKMPMIKKTTKTGCGSGLAELSEFPRSLATTTEKTTLLRKQLIIKNIMRFGHVYFKICIAQKKKKHII